jgi:hypothetical protein
MVPKQWLENYLGISQIISGGSLQKKKSDNICANIIFYGKKKDPMAVAPFP